MSTNHMKNRVELLDSAQGLELIKKINLDLYQILLPAQHNQALKLIKLKYDYGDPILQGGNLCLPPHSDPGLLSTLDLDYCAVPLALILTKSCEVFLGNSERVLSLNLISLGQFLGIPEVLSWQFKNPQMTFWNVSAGSHSAFMLPSIGDRTAHKRLQEEYHFIDEPPKSVLEQCKIFSAINQASSPVWSTEILLFPQEWFFDKLIGNALLAFLNQKNWQQHTPRVSHLVRQDALTEILGYIMKKRRMMIPPLILDKLKHILMLSETSLPGFSPSLDQAGLPLNSIQRAYSDCYQLKIYAPLIVEPKFLSLNTPVYYFLNYPYFHNFYKGPVNSLLAELKLIQTNLMLLLTELKKSESAKFFAHLDQVQYDFFHFEAVASENIFAASRLPYEDDRWRKACGNLAFPVNASAFGGCVKISLDKTK